MALAAASASTINSGGRWGAKDTSHLRGAAHRRYFARKLQATYLPNQVSMARLADVARVEGHRRLRVWNKSRPKR
jgi:hypothetical protein